MTANFYIELPDRGLIALAGDDARSFLQGLVTNDVEAVTPSRAIKRAPVGVGAPRASQQ